MANIASSKKDARRSAERAVRNRSIRSAVKTRVTKVRRAVAEGAAESLPELAEAAISELDRAVAKGVLHRNNAARRKSRLVKRVQAAGTAEGAHTAPAKGTKGASKAAPKAAGKAAGKASAKPAASKPAAKTSGKTSARKPAAKK